MPTHLGSVHRELEELTVWGQSKQTLRSLSTFSIWAKTEKQAKKYA